MLAISHPTSMNPPANSIHIDLDSAWPPENALTGAYLDCREWGPRLRYTASTSGIESFYDFVRAQTAQFTLFGSGDFHHLTALWLRRIAEPFTLVSFDNHPDWDTRPPRWGCGTWINRAIELPALRRVSIWGCGNFELNWPGCLFVNRAALRAGKVEVWPWLERLKPSGRKRWGGITSNDWRRKFSTFAGRLSGQNVYITVDIDSLDRHAAVTNWENGLFTIEDIVWALGEIRSHAEIIGGDLCGAYSQQRYARWGQRIAAAFDHPRVGEIAEIDARRGNLRAMEPIWRALAGG